MTESCLEYSCFFRSEMFEFQTVYKVSYKDAFENCKQFTNNY